MQFPVIEIVDRYCIAVVKHEKTNGANKEELDFYLEQMQSASINPLNKKVIELIEHHSYVWTLEDDFKKGRIDSLPLEEIGQRAIHIRDIGYKRQELKNNLAELVNIDSVREIKQ
jgi:deoxyxylulose-5-phosphate synthase